MEVYTEDDVNYLKSRIKYLEDQLQRAQFAMRDEFMKAAITGLCSSWRFVEDADFKDLVNAACEMTAEIMERRL